MQRSGLLLPDAFNSCNVCKGHASLATTTFSSIFDKETILKMDFNFPWYMSLVKVLCEVSPLEIFPKCENPRKLCGSP